MYVRVEKTFISPENRAALGGNRNKKKEKRKTKLYMLNKFPLKLCVSLRNLKIESPRSEDVSGEELKSGRERGLRRERKGQDSLPPRLFPLLFPFY